MQSTESIARRRQNTQTKEDETSLEISTRGICMGFSVIAICCNKKKKSESHCVKSRLRSIHTVRLQLQLTQVIGFIGLYEGVYMCDNHNLVFRREPSSVRSANIV